jgi:hypothetical protein
MVLDNATICPITDDEEFFDSIKTYEEEWFIGTEADNEYSQNILLNKPYIFSLCKDSSKVSFICFIVYNLFRLTYFES